MVKHTYTNTGSSLWWITFFALALFIPMFIFRQAGAFDFWYWMSSNLLVLMTMAFLTDRANLDELKKDIERNIPVKVMIGILAAILLFALFYAGNIIIREIFSGAGDGIQNVYAFKQEAAPLRIGILMLLVIGPGEELFWRGYLQRRFGQKIGKTGGFLLASALYTAVHLATGNMVLVLAALVCGLFWGWLYMRYRSMIINIVSHTLWDIGVFLLLPFHQ